MTARRKYFWGFAYYIHTYAYNFGNNLIGQKRKFSSNGVYTYILHVDKTE